VLYISTMKKLVSIAFFLCIIKTMQGQTDHSGAYYMKGVAETSSGFQLKPDSTFLFFFSYGALDRTGSGTWRVSNNRIVFNSRPYPGADFKLLRSAKRPGDSITIKITDPNKQLTAYVNAGLRKGNVFPPLKNSGDGVLRFAKQDFDALVLAFEFCPERNSNFSSLNRQHNYFEFAFEEWMMEVFLKDFSLAISGNRLTGHHPLDAKGQFVYEKE